MTIPTDAQLLIALQASRGDDVYCEDEDTTALEARVARLTGKEAAMFAVSGTMTNRVFPFRFGEESLTGRTGHSDSYATTPSQHHHRPPSSRAQDGGWVLLLNSAPTPS